MPELGSGSELFFFSFPTTIKQARTNKNETKQMIEQWTK
jgi:hypothetical protein